MSQKPFYITTTLPYVNAEPHIGFAMEIIRADIIARAKKLEGYDVFSNTGTDEHGVKIFRKAQEMHIDTQEYTDQVSAKFKDLLPRLGILKETNFIRTTDAHHIKSAQEFWNIVNKNGFIYKKNYSVKYCVGCELEKTESELVEGRCPLHPLQELENIQEENYFFKFSAFQKQLLDLYDKNPNFVVPASRQNEIRSFVERGLEDFSISRLATKMPWGIAVPNDTAHVMYVWFDALVNYVSAVGWNHDMKTFDKWWVETGGVVQYCGKDNLRQQSAMWQAMLMAAGLSPSKTIIIDGFITGEGGVKMSKSLGNTVDPIGIVDEYGTDALRYFMAKELSPFEDSPFTMEKFKELYNAGLANGVGNLTSRIMKMAVTNAVTFTGNTRKVFLDSSEYKTIKEKYDEGFRNYNIQQSANAVWELISNTDKIIQNREPFKKIKSNFTEAIEDMCELVMRLRVVGELLQPIMPETANKIIKLVDDVKIPETPLFMRK